MEYVWWEADDSGYTKNLKQAGIYSEEKINSNPLYYKNNNTYPVPVEVVEKLITNVTVPTLSDNWHLMDIPVDKLKHY